ncbi:MAG TPA: tRNA (N(6)-L-threonylcarbamoyladenosine(37)-C(2))-methylthiotransferase MtaB [Candidatus Didemnitutus sp.]|nr:tRNA (N(6)-L-threonylcarbamoyladenosine(37)-C(2))-methylthiotransferase MtaB [Candidatus Didemnitutus sp.]
MRIALHTLGCKLNYSETATIREDLVQRGHEIVPFSAEADVLLVNTCSVTENADIECRKIVRRGLRTSPNASVVVTGCYAQLQPEEIASIDGVKAVIGMTQKFTIGEKLDEILSSVSPRIYVDEISTATVFNGSRTGRGDSRTRSFLKIQDGCDYSCTFCTIPRARGPARAMSLASIQRDLESIAQEGYHEVVLSGINLGEYRGENGERFIDVVNMIEEMAPPFRVRISSIEPNTLTPEIIDLISVSRTFVPHLHVPLQSGSADVLRDMRRRYNPAMYAKMADRVTSSMPHAALGIDVIVGFPGETDAHFEETVSFLEGIPFTYLHVFTYSERENTPASTMHGQVDVAVRRLRTQRLRAMSQIRTMEFHKGQCGSRKVMIPEGYDPTTGRWDGWTENHVYVSLEAPSTLQKRPYSVELLFTDDDAVRVTPNEPLEFTETSLLPILNLTDIQ